MFLSIREVPYRGLNIPSALKIVELIFLCPQSATLLQQDLLTGSFDLFRQQVINQMQKIVMIVAQPECVNGVSNDLPHAFISSYLSSGKIKTGTRARSTLIASSRC
jgi:hypothetical protein